MKQNIGTQNDKLGKNRLIEVILIANSYCVYQCRDFSDLD